MNPQVLAAIELINSIFVSNGNQEITGQNSNSVLNSIIEALYNITGNPEYLNTETKENLVSAINELKDLLGQINTINLFSGTADPNIVEPNGGDYEVRDFYMQNQTNVGTIALWIYTGVVGIGWLNLTDINNTIFVINLPTTGIDKKLYIRTSDNTLWRWQPGGSVQYPVSVWVPMGGTPNDYVSFEPQTLSLEEQGQARDNIGVSSTYKQRFTYNSVENPDKNFQLHFIPTNVIYLTDTGSFLQGSDVGRNQYSIDTETAILSINAGLKDESELIICYEHQNQIP